MADKLKIPETKVLPSDSKITPKVSTTLVAGTGIQTYTFPAQEVPNTNKVKNATFLNRVTGQIVTVDQNASATTKIEQAYGIGGNAQAGLYVLESAAKGLTINSSPKGMAVVIASRIAISTLKYHYGTSQYGWLGAFGSAVGTNIKLTTLGYFKGLKVPKRFQEKFDKLAEQSYHFHHNLEDRTYSPFKQKGKLGKLDAEFNYLDFQLGANRIEAKYFNLKTGIGAVVSGVSGIKTLFGIGQPNGTHANSPSETHPQNSIGSETYKNTKEANNPTNIVKVVTTAQTEVPDDITEKVIGNKKVTPNQKLLFNVRYKRKWAIAEAIANNQEFVEIAPKVYLDLKKYDAPKEIVDAVKWVQFEKNPNQKAKPMTGSPGAALGIGGTATKIALVAEQIYEVGKQFYAIGEVWYKSNFGQTDDEAKSQALAQQRLQLIAGGGKEVKNPDGSVTITFDITKQKQATDNVLNKGQNVQMVIANKNFAAKKAKEAQTNALFNVQSLNTALSKAKTLTQINTGLGVNTQRGPQTGTFGQNIGWGK